MLLKSKDATSVSAIAYDKLLAAGWFRGARFMNKPDYICVESGLFSPVHIRLNLAEHQIRKSHAKIKRKVESRFDVIVGPASLCPEAEFLYFQQKPVFQAFIYPRLEDAMYVVNSPFGYQTYSVKVFDGDRLIAISYFDVGKNSVASLLGLYDNAYHQYSLGTYTMLKEVEWSIQNDIEFYYPGYVLDDLKVFGYKLELGNYEFKDPRGRWMPLSHYRRESSKSVQFKAHFDRLVQWLSEKGMQGKTRIYPLHYAYNPSIDQAQFYKYPIYHEIVINGERHAASYDPIKGTYVWSQIVKSPLHSRLLSGLELSHDLRHGKHYEMHLLETVREIHLPVEMIDAPQMSNVTPTGQWSDPITSFKMKASLK